MPETVVLAFSGGLDTSWCVPFLREEQGARVVTAIVDVGGMDDARRDELARLSRELGAEEHHCLDARSMFFDEVLRYLVFGNVLRGHLYPLCVGSERVLQAREVARLARRLGATAIAHGCTAAGNDQVRFEVALRTLAPDLEVRAPIQERTPSRQEEVDYLNERKLPVPAFGAAYSVNEGLWGVTIGGRETIGTRETIPEDAWVRTKGAFDSPRPIESHAISFDRGIPNALDGKRMAPVELVEKLDALAAPFGIGRGIHLGDTILGMKGRVAFEAPAATVLITAHRELEKLTLTGRQQLLKDTVSRTYGDLIHEGQFLEPTCRDIEALMRNSQQHVTGEVFLSFRPGSVFVDGVSSIHSLTEASASVYGEEVGEWSPRDALGFSRIQAIPGMLYERARNDGPQRSDT